MDATLETGSQDEFAHSDVEQSGSPLSYRSAVSEESAARGGAGVDQTQSVGPNTYAAALQPPSEAHFKQLASLHLLRATYQQEERDVNRQSVERVLQSAQRQNAAHKIRLAYMQQQISNQMRIVEAQEARLAELLSHLQTLTLQPCDLMAQESTVLQLIRDMNDVRAGHPREWPAFMADLMSMGQGEGGDRLEKGGVIRIIPQISEAFVKGDATSCHLHLSLPPFLGRPVSLQEMSSCSFDVVLRIVRSFGGAMKAQLQRVHSSEPSQAAQALDQSQLLAEELVACQLCFIAGQQPIDYAGHYPWFRKSPVTSIPVDVMQNAVEQSKFREEQLVEIQHMWQQHLCTAGPLKEREQHLRDELRCQLNQASGIPECQSLYLHMMETVAELEGIWKAQANGAIMWGVSVNAKVVDTLQVSTMLAYHAPYPCRFDLMLTAGLLRPKCASLHPIMGSGDSAAHPL